jgi:hypothetical protein
MLKLPTIDQLPYHGTTAYTKWLGHNKFRAITKIFQGLENIFEQEINFWDSE